MNTVSILIRSLLFAFLACVAFTQNAIAKKEIVRIEIAYIAQSVERPPNLSNLETPPDNEGLAGGQISISDNNTTGRFLKQEFRLEHRKLQPEEDAVAAFAQLVEQGIKFFVLQVPADTLLKMADAVKGKNVLLFNASAPDDRLRGQRVPRATSCILRRAGAMYTDALAQFFVRETLARLVPGQRVSASATSCLPHAVKKSAKEIWRQNRGGKEHGTSVLTHGARRRQKCRPSRKGWTTTFSLSPMNSACSANTSCIRSPGIRGSVAGTPGPGAIDLAQDP